MKTKHKIAISPLRTMKEELNTSKSKSSSSYNSSSNVPFYFKLVKISLKGDIVAEMFIFGWILTLFTVEVLFFQFGRLTAKFYEILPARSSTQLTTLSLQFATFFVMMFLSKGTLIATRGLLARAMRRNLTNNLQEKYVCLLGFKSILRENKAKAHSNENFDFPDQRITEDIEKFTIGLLKIGEILFISPILILFYTIQVSQNLGTLSIVTIYFHFALSFAVLSLGLGRLKRLTIEKERREASFRSEHVSLRENMESFYLINFENILMRLNENLRFKLQKLLFISKQLLLTEALMAGGKDFFKYSGVLLNFLLLASELTWGRWREEFDVTEVSKLITTTSFVSLYLIYRLSKLSSVLDSIGALNGQVERLKQFIQALDVDVHDDPFEFESDQFKVDLSLNKKNLNLSVKPGQNVSISGANGTGKTSILRFISGLWPVDPDNASIKVSRPLCKERPFFMSCPQNCVTFTGSLYDLVGIKISTNPSDDDEESKIDQNYRESVEEVLEIVGLNLDLLVPFDLKRSSTTWQTILSPGQNQRISLARALLHRPHLLGLDETFSTISANETEEILKEFERRAITIIFIETKNKTESSLNFGIKQL